MSDRQHDPLERRFLDRPLYLAGHVRLPMHFAAWFAAGGDGKHEVLASLDADRMDPLFTTPGTPADIETFWISRNRSGYRQADQRDFRAMAARVAPQAHALASLVDRRALLVADRVVEDAELTRLRDRPKPEVATIQRGPAELTAHEGVLLSRRMKTWQAPVTATEARIAAIDAEIRSIDVQAADLAAVLETAFGVTIARSTALRHHYERLAETYRRRLTHRHKGGARFQAAAMATITIPAPDWTNEPNPWIPADYVGLGSAPTTHKENAGV